MDKFNYSNISGRLKQGGAIHSEEELGHLMGKGRSYISSLKSKDKPPSLESLTHLAFNLENDIQEFEDDLRAGVDISVDRITQCSILYELQNELFEQIRQHISVSRNQPKLDL